MEKMMTEELLCTCGCKLFIDSRPFSMEESAFMVWNFRENLKPLKSTIPILQCVGCGKIHVPKASFAGKNMMDEEVKLYAELLNYVKTRNSLVDQIAFLNTKVDEIKKFVLDIKVEKNVTVKTTSACEESAEDIVTTVPAGSGPRKSNKK